MPENELTIPPGGIYAVAPTYTREQMNLIKRTIAKGATDDELALFIQFCRSKKMDPFSRHLYAIQRREKDEQGNWHSRMVIQTGIDGFRAQAGRNPHYAGQLGPFWCGPDGAWTDVWLKSEAPVAARVGVLRSDFKEPCWGVARFADYTSGKGLWLKMQATMIAKCAEAQALRKAFPDELSGIYSTDEMDQAIDITASHADVRTPSVAGAGASGSTQRAQRAYSEPAPAPAHVSSEERRSDEEGGEGLGAQGSAPTEPAEGESREAAAGIPLSPIHEYVKHAFPDAIQLTSKQQRQALVKMARQVMGGKVEGNAWLQQAGATSNLSVDLFKHLTKQLMDIDSANNKNVESFDQAESQEPDIDF